jgi:hypothetical protein
MTPARMLIACFVAFVALSFAGCSKKPAALTGVTGRVFYKGATLRDGVIVFSPDTSRGESGHIAYGKIRTDGTYTLATADAPGAAAGWYRVTVSSVSGASVTYDSTPVPIVPEKYRDPQLSLLQCEVKANQDNRLDFNLD